MLRGRGRASAQEQGNFVLNITVEYHEEWTTDGRGDGKNSGYPVLYGSHLINGTELTGGMPKNDDLDRGRSDSFLSVKAAERIAKAQTDEAP